jgi:hypothetical protein
MYTLSSKDKLKVNDVKDALIVEESYWLAKTFDTNAKSAFISQLLLAITVVAIDISHSSALQTSNKTKLLLNLTVVEVVELIVKEVNIRKRRKE